MLPVCLKAIPTRHMAKRIPGPWGRRGGVPDRRKFSV